MYDINANFVFPLCDLENDNVKTHTLCPPEDIDDMLHQRIGPDPSLALYAVLDKTTSSAATVGDGNASGYALAGVIGWIGASTAHLKAEIGFLIIFPAFQRKRIAVQSVGLLLRQALDLPSSPTNGWGLRRVIWQAYVQNEASLRLAERMGFVQEGVMRWDRVHPVIDNVEDTTLQPRKGDPREENAGRHAVVLGLCWDDWEKERERILGLAQVEKPMN
ncbi:hypothetical protein CONPUDRAFT_146331 [Coniophora puteana RWD-64-598 SS2]|uniref:N-acetyltransferase domain-containing protein n=1 Tax=Coniophora puteana (strain RWD-64-598) TaxID=741705 RepID=A0A5M3ME77_CONPW|nr:uncharacterized protein CONPUDRAFT_146331 [Coniophora puteana RWD-64-598 SS2]EIW77357.1 hypothetical protein CONPUDRAFT_146331 [Coniophora puteana RWD-64-598 SS2]